MWLQAMSAGPSAGIFSRSSNRHANQNRTGGNATAFAM